MLGIRSDVKKLNAKKEFRNLFLIPKTLPKQSPLSLQPRIADIGCKICLFERGYHLDEW